jgi:hypothetical protein
MTDNDGIKAQSHANKLESITQNCCWNCAHTNITGVDTLWVGAKCTKNKRKITYSGQLKRDLLKMCCDEYEPVRR